jgi:hypothetical protein
MSLYGLSLEIMSSVSLAINVTINMEVNIMINIITMICLVAGTALLGRPGWHVSKTRGDLTNDWKMRCLYMRVSAGRFDSSPAPPFLF